MPSCCNGRLEKVTYNVYKSEFKCPHIVMVGQKKVTKLYGLQNQHSMALHCNGWPEKVTKLSHSSIQLALMSSHCNSWPEKVRCTLMYTAEVHF